MNKVLGFIGAGNMGSSLIRGIKESGSKILIYEKYRDKAKSLIDKNTFLADSVEEVITKCDIVFLCVKPDAMEEVLDSILDLKEISNKPLYITIAAGKLINFYENKIKEGRFIRVMPNMPASIKKGMSSICKGNYVSKEELDEAVDLLDFVGKTIVVQNESDMNITTAVAGSGPAFVFMFIKALEDIAIKYNISRDDDRIMACQMVLGSAEYALNQKDSLEDLIKSICSPNGTTIEGVNVLNSENFELIVQKAVLAAKNRSAQMSKDEKSCTNVEIYTDGACINNPGPGGYAAILIHNGIEKEITGYKEKATNNEMELMAALQGLMQLNKSCEVKLYSDSAYLINAFNQKWIDSWKNNGWKRGRNDEIKNLQLWKLLYEMNIKHSITWIKVKGHSDNEYNNRCDKLANKAIKENKI